ncbi:hypothetical protein ES319_A05G109900v1 [Gossypium barbadense]|uniref:Homeobox domain-containing protein n=3 Tax=Gossypium TaxID=3633 RepID=A0A5J5VLW8_GOSBA|nr:hypothetical protein ES319_A05G109900v1 [Gossypium barbadense]TYH16377.1 hypothetical protein ES288_A05G112000v1 [Gossypium darwinii]TYI26429.1 hypothetical protein ES332_A05G113300v1 [Gossypium tomentosum]KAB2081112.1 hypothetical protein ES319_A05G109900v1 [Gossypium barbadense]TYI26430.1 hypothetical protein ES332_A05G113300v1 [Gossypium tomentosum]
MDMSKFRPESHVAQQRLRDKLRVQQSSKLVQQLEDFPNNLEDGCSSVLPALNPGLAHVRNDNLLYDPDVFSSDIIHVSSNSSVLPSQRDTMLHQEMQTAPENRQLLAEESSFPGMSQSNLSKFDGSSKVSGDPHDCGNWRGVDSQHNCDWMVGYASGLAVRESNQDHRFVGEVMSNNATILNSAYQDVQSTHPNPGSEIYSLERNLHFVSPSLYQNSLQDVVTTAQGLEVGSHEPQNVREAAKGSRTDYCGNEANPLHFGNAGTWMNTPLGEHSQQWGAELGFLASKSSVELGAAASDATTHGLSLSLSSHPTPKICGADPVQFTGNQYGSDGFLSKPGEFKELRDSKTSNMGHFFSMQKSSSTCKADGKSLQDAGGTSAYVHRQTIPLGPFTGYATILKNSRFLKPAQELLDEFCHISNSKPVKVCDTSEEIPGEVSACKESNSGASATFYSSNESCKHEYQQKKAKLVYMHEEVCRRYKLYHQQMQMVVSSFESVAGLGAAIPYVPLALKTVARDFRCLRNAILDQIKHVSRALGEDLLSPTTGTSGSKGDINMSGLKCFGQKSGGVNMGFLEPQQHSWRPQRGLPERSVAILRAWLFEHFLHPYPTDTDKHMLATQTGLSRNQVSNWFINARVRVWKPMVEEIHMLESKCLAEGNQNSSKSEGKSTSEGRISWPNDGQSINRSCVNALSDKQLACADMLVADAHDLEHWNHEKRSSMDFHIPTSMEGSLMGFAPYQQSRLENGGLGAVSLTLGLMHGVESAQQQQRQQQQQYQQQEHHSRRQFGGHLIHDFAG